MKFNKKYVIYVLIFICLIGSIVYVGKNISNSLGESNSNGQIVESSENKMEMSNSENEYRLEEGDEFTESDEIVDNETAYIVD